MTSDGSTSVAVRDLTKVFPGRQGGRRRAASLEVTAVDSVTLDVGEGEFFSMLGPSGCGKTTMLRMIAGLDYPTAGTIEIFGRSVADVPPRQRPVNTVFQQYALFPHMSVGENVDFGLKMQRVAASERRRRVADALDMVRLSGLDQRKPAELSGGQQQRVALARALVNRPRVLLLDEPLGALDQKLRVEMQQELHSLQRDLGISFVFVTHDQDEALAMSDRIAVMNEGRVLQLGSASDVYERPADRFVADFIGQITVMDAVVAAGGSVALATGQRLLAETGDRPAGSAVGVAIRPERVVVSSTVDAVEIPPDRRLDGRAGEVTYLGQATTLSVDVDWLHIAVRIPAGGFVPTPGDDVTISWDPEALLVLDGGPAPSGATVASGE